ncbi:MAG: arylsulfatase [Bryobacterales bacterium]|nr:arylsulfatase [Bryobacterales bacterium]
MSWTRRAFLASCAAPALVAQRPPRPNILFILADDLGLGDLGCYGQRRLQTPNIDKLASQGMRFTQAYAGATVCAPSRSCLMTGLHGGHTRVRDNIPHGVFLEPDDVTVAEALKQAGYHTAAIGKWSLGNPGSWGVATYQGFDRFYGHLNQDQAHFYYPDYLWEDDTVVLLTGNRGEAKQEYTSDLFTAKALDFIGENAQRPFFLYLAYTLPHWSDYPSDDPDSQIVPTDEPYSDEPWPQVERNYAAMVTRLDRHVGALMDELAQRGLDSNTLVIFTSDNGPSRERSHDPDFFTSGAGLRGYKRDLYEGGIRAPMIARWTGRIEPGSTSDHVCAFWDFLPTAVELAGLPAPKRTDGISYAPTLLGGEQREHEYLYFDYGHARNKFGQAVRAGKWKGVRNGVGAALELYDLNADPQEKRDVASAHPDVVKRLEGYMAEAYEPSPQYPVKQLSGR